MHPGNFRYSILLIVTLLVLGGCNHPPQVSVQEKSITAWERSTVTLSASIQDEDSDDHHQIQWQQISGPLPEQTQGVDQTRLTLQLPSSTRDDTLVFKVTVTDQGQETASETVTIHLKAYRTLAQVSYPDSGLQQCAQARLYYLAWKDLGDARELDCNNSHIESIAGIGQAPNLVRLNLQQNQIRDLSPLTTLTQLTSLNLSQNPVMNLQPLAGLTQLTSLSLARTGIQDLSPLANLDQLEELFLGWNRFPEKQLSHLGNLVHLRTLYLNDNNLTDIAPLARLTNLESLYLHNNDIRDISPLLKLPHLKHIYLEQGNHNIPCQQLQALIRQFGPRTVIKPRYCRR